MRLGIWFCVLLCAWLPSITHADGVIHGVVRTPGSNYVDGSAPDPYPGRAASMPGMHEAKRGQPQDAVIYVEKVPASAESILAHVASSPKLAQKDQCFAPRVLPIAAGTTVAFPNLDPIFHNVFSLSPIKRFDLGKYPRGHSRSITFTKTGLVNVYCDIHSDMAAFILVLPQHAFTQPDDNGRYALPSLPPGHYVVRGWHPDLSEQRRDVDVPRAGDVVLDVDF